jgi:hypothetical protein
MATGFGLSLSDRQSPPPWPTGGLTGASVGEPIPFGIRELGRITKVIGYQSAIRQTSSVAAERQSYACDEEAPRRAARGVGIPGCEV